MCDLIPFYGPRFLKYNVEAFAKIAVSNAIWLTGEWIALGKPAMSTFKPDVTHSMEPRCRDEAIATIECCPAHQHFDFFVRSFWQGPHKGGEHLLRFLQFEHADLLSTAFQAEWTRIAGASRLSHSKMLPKPDGNGVESKV